MTTHRLDGNAVYGYSMAYTFVQVLPAAGKDLTREKLVDAVEKGGFKGRLNRAQNGAQTYFGPTYVIDDGDGEVKEHTEAPTAPPADAIPTS